MSLSPAGGEWWGAWVAFVRATAVAMVVGGLVALPAALMGIDAFDELPAALWLFSIGWLGVYVLYPIATFVLGRRLLGG